MLQNNSSRSAENGNVFLFILLGVVLFGALAFIISRGMRSDTTVTMSDRKAELVAVDILTYAQRIERSISKMQSKGISENDISFDNGIVAGYAHTPPQPDNHNVFHPDGGGMNWQSPPKGANDGNEWIFTGTNCIPDLGTGDANCHGNGETTDSELIILLPAMNKTVCTAINKKLGVAGDIPVNTGSGPTITKFTGTFTDMADIILDKPHNAACFDEGGASYHFYYALIAR